jgi:hypothetical protein
MCSTWNRFEHGGFLRRASPGFAEGLLQHISIPGYRQLIVTFLSEYPREFAQSPSQTDEPDEKITALLLQILGTAKRPENAFFAFSVFHGVLQETTAVPFFWAPGFLEALISTACGFKSGNVVFHHSWHVIGLIFDAGDSNLLKERLANLSPAVVARVSEAWGLFSTVERPAAFPVVVQILQREAQLTCWEEATPLFFGPAQGTGFGPPDPFCRAYVAGFGKFQVAPGNNKAMKFVTDTARKIVEFVRQSEWAPDNRHIIELWRVIVNRHDNETETVWRELVGTIVGANPKLIEEALLKPDTPPEPNVRFD